MILYTDLQEKILGVIQQNISGYKSLRDTQFQLLNTDGNDDTETLSNIQEYTEDITKLTEFQTKLKSLFTKAAGSEYVPRTLVTELMKICAEKYDETNTTLTNFYSDIVFQAVSSFIVRDDNSAAIATSSELS